MTDTIPSTTDSQRSGRPDLVTNVSVHLLIPVPISPPEMVGFTIRTVGDAMLGGLVMRGVMRAIEHILKYLLAFCVWLGGAYLLAMNNEALFGIFLGSSLIIGGIYLPPRLRTDQPQSS